MLPLENGNSEKRIQGFRRDEQQNLEKALIAGTVDYDELIAGNGIVLTTNTPPSERERIVKMDFALCLDRFIL